MAFSRYSNELQLTENQSPSTCSMPNADLQIQIKTNQICLRHRKKQQQIAMIESEMEKMCQQNPKAANFVLIGALIQNWKQL